MSQLGVTTRPKQPIDQGPIVRLLRLWKRTMGMHPIGGPALRRSPPSLWNMPLPPGPLEFAVPDPEVYKAERAKIEFGTPCAPTTTLSLSCI